MKYKLILQDDRGNISPYYYDVEYNSIINQFGHPLVTTERKVNLPDIHRISHTDPGKKKEISVLKIQLGLGCNYSCTYCLQSSEIPDATKTIASDTEAFIEGLDSWLKGTPQKIEFWGGEPLVYWSKIKMLAPALRIKFPDAVFSMVTNGSLFDQDIIDFIEEYDIHVGISHDGPAQKFRGPDPFTDPEKVKLVNQLFEKRSGKTSFNIVIHSKNYDFNAIYNWFSQRFVNPILSLEGVVAVYDDYTLHNLGAFTPQQYMELVDNIFHEVVVHKTRFVTLSTKVMNFIRYMRNSQPVTRTSDRGTSTLLKLSQKCGMDMEDRIAVDLLGNVITCQNTGSKGKHKIGHVSDYENIRLDTSTHFSHREECMHCPVVRLCRGSCMYLDGDYFAQSCWNEYYFNLGILKAALFLMTGKLMIGVEGDIRRPEYSSKTLDKNPNLKKLYEWSWNLGNTDEKMVIKS